MLTLGNRHIQNLLSTGIVTEPDYRRNPTVRVEFEQAIAIGGIGKTLEATKSKHWGNGPWILPLEPDDEFFTDRITYCFRDNILYNRRFEQRKRLKELLGKRFRPLVGNDRVVAPQLLAGQIVANVAGDPATASDKLVATCSKLPFGEVVGAHALYQSVRMMNQLPDAVVRRLLECKPTRQTIAPGSKVAAILNGKRIDIEVIDDRRFIAVFPDGQRHDISGDPDESPPKSQGNTMSWLILSHFAAIPFVAVDPDTKEVLGRLDGGILIGVGACDIVLRKPEGDMPDKIAVHEIGDDTVIVCHQEGIIEPITFSIYNAMTREPEIGIALIKEAVEQKSLPLLSRINIGLLQIEQQADAGKAAWANRPAPRKYFRLFAERYSTIDCARAA